MESKGITRRRLIGTAAAGAAVAALPRVQSPRQTSSGPACAVSTSSSSEQGSPGSTAAREIMKAGRSVIVLEARDRVGGRVLNHPLGGGDYAESAACSPGRRRTASRHSPQDVGVGTFPTYNTGNNVFWANGRRSEYPSDTPPGTAPPDPVVLPTSRRRSRCSTRWRQASLSTEPWTSPNAEEWDRQTLDTWLRENTSGSDGVHGGRVRGDRGDLRLRAA